MNLNDLDYKERKVLSRKALSKLSPDERKRIEAMARQMSANLKKKRRMAISYQVCLEVIMAMGIAICDNRLRITK